MAARSRHGNGIELEVTEAPDDRRRRRERGRPSAPRPAREAGLLGSEKAGARQREAPGRAEAQRVHAVPAFANRT